MISENQNLQICKPLVDLFTAYSESKNPPVLELQNINHKPVGAIYLNTFKYKNFSISETNNTEKYYLYVDGIGVYFSFFKRIRLITE